MGEAFFTPGLMQAAEVTRYPLHLIQAIGFELTTAKAGEYGIVVPLMRQQRLAVEFKRGSNRYLIVH